SALALFTVAPQMVFAQGLVTEEYFRHAGTPERLAPVAPPPPEEDEKYNFAFGPFRFNVAAGVGLEFNDNIELADHDRKSDFIFRPSVSLDGVWTVSEMTTPRFSIGMRYSKYFQHYEFVSRALQL